MRIEGARICELCAFDSPWGHCVASGNDVPAFHAFFDQAARDLLAG